MKVKRLVAKQIKDTRGKPTIEITLYTKKGSFTASAPNGKSTGIRAVKLYKKSLKSDITAVNNFFIKDINLQNFSDLEIIEDSFKDKVGGNTMIALEYCFLKAIAKQERKEVWEVINPRAKKVPKPIGNLIGGGAHSSGKKPDFQEFQLIPMCGFEKAVRVNQRAHENAKKILKNLDKYFKNKKNDEGAWQTSLNNNEVMEVLQTLRDNMKDEFKVTIHMGLDVAASNFFDGKNYAYKNAEIIKSKKEQISYMSQVSQKFFYLEDPLEENDFKGFSKVLKKSPTTGLITADDLTTTNVEMIRYADKRHSNRGVIIKPNQIGSLLKVKEAVDYCSKHKIKIIFSHRSGETSEDILADLAFGFEADFIKTGVLGKGRQEKLDRMIEIERSL